MKAYNNIWFYQLANNDGQRYTNKTFSTCADKNIFKIMQA